MKRSLLQFAVVAVVAGILLPIAFAGCAAPQSVRTETGVVDVTGGLEVELLRTSDDRTFARYRVTRDGRLSFGGGADAVMEKFSWTGELTPDEIDRLSALIAQNRWGDADPPGSRQPPGLSHTIKLRMNGRRRSFTVLGAEPGVIAVHDLLAAAARRRHGELLDALPRPGEQN